MNATLSSPPKIPLSERINIRMLIVGLVVALIVGYPVYMYVDAAVHGGAKQVGNAWQVDLKALGNFPFDEANGDLKDVPEKWRQLDGKQVVLQGFPYVTNYAGDTIPAFQFVYNVQKCCFGGPPKVQERVFAHVNGGEVPNYNMQFATLQGTLHVRPHKEAGKVVSLFDLDVQKIALAE